MSLVGTGSEVPANSPGRRTRRVLILLFVVYLLLLIWIVLWKFHAPFIGRDDMREIKLIPFASTAGFGASAPFEVAGNLLIFVPFGIYLRVLAPRWRWWRIGALVAGASLLLEVVQYVTAVGSSDVTDVIVNTAGGLAGVALLALVRRGLRSRTTVVVMWVLASLTVVALIVIGLHVSAFPRLPPPGHGVTIIN